MKSDENFQQIDQMREVTLAVLGGATKDVYDNGISLIDYFGVSSSAPDFNYDDLQAAVFFHIRHSTGGPAPMPYEVWEPELDAAFQAVFAQLVQEGSLKSDSTAAKQSRFYVNLVPAPFDRDWQFLIELGGGGQSTTCQVRRKRSGELGVLKLIKPEASEAKMQIAHDRFRNEVDAIGRVKHPAVVVLLDVNVNETTGELGYITRLGTPLESYWERVAESGGAEHLYDCAYQIAKKIAEGLVAVHSEKLVHRDLKPANVIMYDDQPVIIDFGVAAHSNYLEQNLTPLDGQQIGNGFNPPVVYGLDPDDPRRDIAGLGWLYGFLLGEPVGGKRRPQRFHWQFHDMVKEPRRARARAILAACSLKETIPTSAAKFIELMNEYRLAGGFPGPPVTPDAAAMAAAQAGWAESQAKEALQKIKRLEQIEVETKMLEAPLSELRDMLFEGCARLGDQGKLPLRIIDRVRPLGTPFVLTDDDWVPMERNRKMSDLLRTAPDRHPDGICFFACEGGVPSRLFQFCATVVFTLAAVTDGTKFRLQLWGGTINRTAFRFNAYRLLPNGRFRAEETAKEFNVGELAKMVDGWMIDSEFWSPAPDD